MNTPDYSLPLDEREVREALAHYLALSEDELLSVVSKAFQSEIGSGGLAGATGREALERYFEQKLRPSIDLLVARNVEAAKTIASVIEEKKPEITSAGVALLANYLVSTLEVQVPNESRLIIGFAAILLMIGMKAQAKRGA